MQREEYSGYGRRTLLQTIGTGLGAGTIAATAGCLSSLPAMGQQIRYGDVTVPAGTEPRYREWIPADESVEGIVYLEPKRFAVEETGVRPFGGIPEAVVLAGMDYVGVGFENYDHVIGTSSAIVGLGAFDAADVIGTVTEIGYEPIERYEGYEFFHRTNGSDRFLAVRDGRLLLGLDDDRDAVETIIDTREGDHDRLYDTDEGFARITDETGGYPAIMFTGDLGPDRIEELAETETIDSTTAYTSDSESVYHQLRYLFDSDIDLSEHRVRSVLEDHTLSIESETVEVTVNGAFVHVDIEQDHETAREWYDADTTHTPPQVTWWYDRTGDRLRISHRGGDEVDASRLSIGFGGGIDSESLADRQFDDVYDTVSDGDSITVELDAGADADTLSIVHHRTEHSRGVVGSYPLA